MASAEAIQLEKDKDSYGDLKGFKSRPDLIQGEDNGWEFRRGGLFVTRGWVWRGPLGKGSSHWRAYRKDHYNDMNIDPTKKPFSHYYWIGPGKPDPIPLYSGKLPELTYCTYSVLHDTGSGYPEWKNCLTGKEQELVQRHNEQVDYYYNVALKDGGSRRRTKRRRGLLFRRRRQTRRT